MNAQNKQDTLNPKEQSIVNIAALTATGDLENLKSQLSAGLDAGLTINEIKDVLTQLYAYCGFPRSLNALGAFSEVIEQRKKEGKSLVVGLEASPLPANKTMLELGTEVQTKLVGQPVSMTFAPAIDRYLKEHLFGAIFSSDLLTWQQRELATIAALAATPGLEPQLKSHIRMGKGTGISEGQLEQLAGLIGNSVSTTQANVLRKFINRPVEPVIKPDMIIRISEIEILPEFLKEYNAILEEEASASVKVEPGVIAIFPMYQQENPNQIRIVEIYANKDAYQAHLQTNHFQHYKTATLKMVKSLKLVDMNSIDREAMLQIFKKLD